MDAGCGFPLPPGLRHRETAAFVGRAQELSRLRQLWSEVCAGRGARIALLVGEAGIGKSRLARELALEAQEHGAVVLHGSADEDMLVPYQHFVEALRHYLAVAARDEFRRRVEPHSAELEPLTPGLPRRAGEHRPAGALDEAVAAELVVEPSQSDRERFAFSHELVRRTLLERLSRAHRRRIHARLAEVLQAPRGEDALPEIAHHLCEAMPATNRDQALDYATRAAEQAAANLAYAEAVDLFSRALALLPLDDGRRRILALKRALAYQALTHAVMDTARSETRPNLSDSVRAGPPAG